MSILTAAFWCLLCHPDKYKRLQEEVDACFPRGEDSTCVEPHAQMPYLDAVMCVLCLGLISLPREHLTENEPFYGAVTKR